MTQDLLVIKSTPLDQNPAAVYLAGLNSPRSRRTMKQALEVIAVMLTGSRDLLSCKWSALRFQHVAALRAALAERYAPATTNRILCALRGTLLAAWKLEQMPAEDYHRAAGVKSIHSEYLPTGRALSGGEISALMTVCENDTTPAGARDAALIASLYPGGLRRAEVVGLDLSDYDPESGALTVRHGKGDKARNTYLSDDGARRAMADWLNLRGTEPGALFWPINKGGRMINRRMADQAVYDALAKRGELAASKGLLPA